MLAFLVTQMACIAMLAGSLWRLERLIVRLVDHNDALFARLVDHHGGDNP